MYNFIIHTNRHAGNFYRAMFEHVTGCPDDYADPKQRFESSWPTTEDDNWTLMGKFSCDYVESSIVPTPGWSNDGQGNLTRLNEGQEPDHLAYMSVSINFEDCPTDREFQGMTNRVHEFGTWKRTLSGFDLDPEFQITGIEMTKTQTVITTTHVRSWALPEASP